MKPKVICNMHMFCFCTDAVSGKFCKCGTADNGHSSKLSMNVIVVKTSKLAVVP